MELSASQYPNHWSCPTPTRFHHFELPIDGWNWHSLCPSIVQTKCLFLFWLIPSVILNFHFLLRFSSSCLVCIVYNYFIAAPEVRLSALKVHLLTKYPTDRKGFESYQYALYSHGYRFQSSSYLHDLTTVGCIDCFYLFLFNELRSFEVIKLLHWLNASMFQWLTEFKNSS